MTTQSSAASAALPPAGIPHPEDMSTWRWPGRFPWSWGACCRGDAGGGAALPCPTQSSPRYSSAAPLKGSWSGWVSCCSCDLLELLNRNTIMSRQKSFGAYSFFWQLFNGWESQGWAQLMPSMDAVHAHLSLMQGSLSLPHAAVPTAQSALTELNTTSLLPWRCVSNLDHVNDSDYRTATLPDGWHGQSRVQAVVGAERSRQAWPCFVISEWCYRGFLKVFTTGWISGNNLSNVFLIGLLKSHLFFLLILWSRKIPPCSIQRRRRRYWEYVTPLILFDPCRILLPWWTL